MENIAIVDTSVLIDFYRKINKNNSFFFHLANKFQGYGVSVVTHYEIFIGGKNLFFENLFNDFIIFPYSLSLNDSAIKIKLDLKKKRKSIEFQDLIIAATALSHNLPLATLNQKHFEPIDGLILEVPG